MTASVKENKKVPYELLLTEAEQEEVCRGMQNHQNQKWCLKVLILTFQIQINTVNLNLLRKIQAAQKVS